MNTESFINHVKKGLLKMLTNFKLWSKQLIGLIKDELSEKNMK